MNALAFVCEQLQGSCHHLFTSSLPLEVETDVLEGKDGMAGRRPY
jgi:hypothetical protein